MHDWLEDLTMQEIVSYEKRYKIFKLVQHD